MIRFIPEDIEGMYALLLSPRAEKSREDELIKAALKSLDDYKDDVNIEKITGNRTFREKTFSTGRILLPLPLKNILGYLMSNGMEYRGDFSITSVFFGGHDDNSHKKINELFKSMSNGLNGSLDKIVLENGILFMKDKNPYFIVEPRALDYELRFGSSGTARRKLSSFKDFKNDILALSNIITQVVNAFYEGTSPDINYKMYLHPG